MDTIGAMMLNKKEANKLYYAVKGQLIPHTWSQRDVIRMVDSYTHRLWGNNERLPNIEEKFKSVWEKAN